ncbi:hypothetical protein, partial [Photobacterium carnosum]|uniref:hypothetical protein n=1 Tax=Photobacterium carnosum TaxID=2023717 RepID=UPI001E3F9A53
MNLRITINLDQDPTPPITEYSLSQLMQQHLTHWPQGARCATQERDGEVLFWNASINKVRQTRKEATPRRGLIPLIGLRYQMNTTYFEDNNESTRLANDWQCSVVTLEK